MTIDKSYKVTHQNRIAFFICFVAFLDKRFFMVLEDLVGMYSEELSLYYFVWVAVARFFFYLF